VKRDAIGSDGKRWKPVESGRIGGDGLNDSCMNVLDLH
jgi:hypothetical protein